MNNLFMKQNCDLGGAIYPTVSLSNHGCVANTMRHNDGSVCVIRAASTIAKGEEITDNYGHFFQAGKFLHRRYLPTHHRHPRKKLSSISQSKQEQPFVE
jgi:hypothetical protein